mmetsp:Transcript_31943/g.52728  ORF Transcript_31943/g.52728 Transcript_31943/m.52728 type:complete len:222 (-) Transcript_31943:242-907(-)|eukprot:CAMPEP_0119003572 /NCGR_PEP_ID=MMETSP1176-20130426/642_1 /TAXON_ID=265551 /ORGANISM="Synedropsis recta cf, Strain CCMP1620" /LENGTH=221 /DNA_ID=CAMNT_0006955185 /DNA_START=82 /DNA_END=747 /DNA_ORIENTATION=+
MSNTSWTSPHSSGAAAAVDESWLKEEGLAPDSGSGTADAPASSTQFSNADVSTDEAAAEPKEPSSSRKGCGKGTFLFFVSIVFLALFVYSAVVQDNDNDSLLWLFFYALHAAIPCVFLVHYFICFPQNIVYGLSAIMIIYSCALIVIASINLSKTGAGGAKQGTGNEDDRTLQEELIFEVAGAGIGLLSALYHVMVTMCCVTKKEEAAPDITEEAVAAGVV